LCRAGTIQSVSVQYRYRHQPIPINTTIMLYRYRWWWQLQKTMNIPDPKQFVSHLIFIQFNKKLILNLGELLICGNKRAQRALGRSSGGKGQRSQWSHLQRTTNVIHQILVADLYIMLYIKYESSGPCRFKQEDFWNFILKTYLLTPWPTYATNWNGVNNFDRGPPRDYSYEVWSNSH